jgi:preprotein translocase subunit SecD
VAKSGSLPVGRYFLGLTALLAVLYLIVFFPGQRHTPKLGLDLVGGTQVIFTAHTPHGGSPSGSEMDQAKRIITQRVNGSGVTEATVVVQGGNQIVVSIPGDTNVNPSSLGATAKLNFRGVIAPPSQVTCTPAHAKKGAGGGSGTSGTSGQSEHERLLNPVAKKSPKPPKASSASNAPKGEPKPGPAKSQHACTLKSVAALKKAVTGLPDPTPKTKGKPSTSPVYTSGGLSASVAKQVQAQLANFDCSTSRSAPDPKNDYYIACQSGAAYLLGPIIVPGTQVSTAAAGAPDPSHGQTTWTVNLDLKSSGQSSWAKYTGAHNVGGTHAQAPNLSSCAQGESPCVNFVAFTLDGKVISSPYNEQAINGGKTQISGHFTQHSANQLAQQLKYGALPLNFTADTAQTVSATLGSSQLKAGLLAGGIGLILVVIYSLLYYRALGLVTIASLLVSGALVYASIVMLGTQIGFTLSLSGIAGFIVAVGITADSFVVFFERIKDEVHEGRSARVAIPRAWIRARRTILSADTVSFLAAAILYYFAAGDVKGFAFTLGLSTILDLIVVFLFTHPLISLLSRNKGFGTGKLTGLNALREGAVPAGVAVASRAAARRTTEHEQAVAGSSSAVTLSKSSVATLDREDEGGGESAEPAGEPGTGASEQAPQETDAPASRRRTIPQPGSAAERAAARRARLREKGQG